MNEVTPARTIRGFFVWLPVGIIAILVIFTLSWLGAEGSWWWQGANANHQNQIIQNGNSYQETLRSEITSKIGDVEQMTVQIGDPAYAADKANIEQSRFYAASIVCGDAAQITGVALRPQQDSWVRLNCLDGNVRPSSIYYVQGGAGQ